MEFANHPSVPFIADAGSEQDWARQHVAEQIHMAEPKGSALLPLRRRSVVALKRRAGSDVRHRPDSSTSGVNKRRRVERPAHYISNKPISTADKVRSAGDWEQMLKLSTNNLQGLYAKMMDKTPAPGVGRLLGDRFPQRVAEGDRGMMAARAMHHAAGCCSEGGADEDEGEGEDETEAGLSSSGEETADWAEMDSSSDDQPATPDTAQMDDDDGDVDGDVGAIHFYMEAAS
jgi:hypothetical protein